MLLYQPEHGYCYNSDSIFLYGFIRQLKLHGKVLDAGAGSGIVGLLSARDFPKITLEAVEKQSLYAEFARRNAQVNGIEYTLHEGDFLELGNHGSYDWILSNPPFYHEGVSRSENEILHQARYNLHLPLEAFAQKMGKLLRSKGEIAICYDALQFAELCCALGRAGLRVVDVQFVHSKVERSSHLVLVHAKKGSKSYLNVLPPLITFGVDGEYTEQAKEIYTQAKVHSIKCPTT